MPPSRGLDDRMARVESMLAELTALSTPAAQSLTEELLTTVLELHGTGLQRVLDVIEDTQGGDALLARLDEDEVVRSILLLHGLHPRPLRQRVEGALETVRPMMHAHRGGVELLAIDSGVVHLRLKGACHGCSASAQTMRNAVEKAIYDAAPDIESITVEGLASPPTGPPAIDCLKPLPMATASAQPTEPGSAPELDEPTDEPARPAGSVGTTHGRARVRALAEHPSIALRPVVRA